MSKGTILVTGGSGLLGRAMQRELEATDDSRRKQFVFLSSKDADLTDLEATRQLFAKHQPRIVVHLAAKVGGLFAHLNDTQDSFYSDNNAINENVLQLAYQFRVQKCISCLSTCIFPDQLNGQLLDETNIHQGPPHHSNWGYAMAKRRVDRLNREYNRLARDANIDSLFTCVIPTNIYGPNDQFDLDKSHVVAGLIHRAYLSSTEAKSRGHSEAGLLVFGSGKPLRQFVYAKDLAKLLIWLTFNYTDPEPLVLCPNDELSIGQLAEKICSIFGEKFAIKLNVEYEHLADQQNDGQFKKTASNLKLLRLLRDQNFRDFQFTPIEVGLRETIDWLCENYPRVRM